MQTVDERDRLIGAAAITRFVNTLLDPGSAVSQVAVERWIDRQTLPTHRFGRQIIASKTRIRAAIDGEPLPRRR